MKKNRKGYYPRKSTYYGYGYPKKSKRNKKTIIFVVVTLILLLFGSGIYFVLMQPDKLISITNKWNDPDISAVTGEEKQKSDWQSKINEISNTASSSSDKYVLLLDYMMNYKSSDREINKFTNAILEDYQNGPFLNAIDNEEKILTNIFKSYIVSEYTRAETNYELKTFAYNYQQALSYVYRGLEAVNSEFVKGKEQIMNNILPKLVKGEN